MTSKKINLPYIDHGIDIIGDEWEEEEEEESVPAPCSRTALVRDRAIDEIKAEKKGNKVEKVDEKRWAEIVKKMKDKEKRKEQRKKAEDGE